MNDSKGSTDLGWADATADYRLREVEVRLDRRMTSIEAKRGRAVWGMRILGAALFTTLTALAVVLGELLPRNGTWELDSVSTRQMVLRDAEGIERGRLATDSEGRAQLSLSDMDGRERLRLTVLADGSPGVTISDPDARPRAVLAYLPDGTTNLVFADAEGTSRAVLGLEPDGSTQALFADHNGTIRTLVGVGADGIPAVSVFEDIAAGPSAP